MRALLFCALCLTIACGDDDVSPDAGFDSGIDFPQDASADSSADAGPTDAGTDAPEPMNARERLGWNGPEHVGYRTLPLTYTRPDGAGERELELHIWYPATERPDGAFPVQYSLSRSVIAYEDAPAKAGSYPVLMFSHGHQAVPDAAGLLMEHFASHGWIVLSPRHTGNTTADGPRMTDIYYLRPHDLRASLDFALAHEEISALMGTPRVVSGHSFGGYTAFAAAGATYDTEGMVAACESGDLTSPVCDQLDEDALALFRAGFADDRYDAVIAMASGDQTLFGDGVAAIELPVFQMVAEADGHPSGSAGDDAYWNGLDGADDLRFNLLGGAHNSFTDICVSLPGFPRCSEQDPAVEIELVRMYALAFVADRLLSNPDGAEVLAQDEPLVEIDRR